MSKTQQFLTEYREAREKATEWLEFTDLGDDFEAREEALAERSHCGTCCLNGITEIIEPVVMDYIAWLEERAGIPENDRAGRRYDA